MARVLEITFYESTKKTRLIKIKVKPALNSLYKIPKLSEGCFRSPDAQSVHVSHVSWLRGTWHRKYQECMIKILLEIYIFSSGSDYHFIHFDAPVALAYTTRALGSLFCSSKTASPVFVGLDDPIGQTFFAL